MTQEDKERTPFEAWAKSIGCTNLASQNCVWAWEGWKAKADSSPMTEEVIEKMAEAIHYSSPYFFDECGNVMSWRDLTKTQKQESMLQAKAAAGVRFK